MPAKQLMFSESAHEGIKNGVRKLAAAVRITLGPVGRNVVLKKSWGSPRITKDGVTVSKEIELPDPFENMGAKMVNEVASKTGDTVGDGTTTAVVLAEAIFNEGLRNITAGANPLLIKRGIDRAVEVSVAEIAKQATKVKEKDKDAIARIATVSANGDSEIGNLLATAMDEVGREGVVTIEEGKGMETEKEEVTMGVRVS